MKLKQGEGKSKKVTQVAGSQVRGQLLLGQPGPTIVSGQETVLPHSFSTMTLHNRATGAWNMDTAIQV